jgi:hypothetical protein
VAVFFAVAAGMALVADAMRYRDSRIAARRTERPQTNATTSAPPISSGPAEDFATFSLNWDKLGRTTRLLISAARPLEKVVVMGRFALPVHYVSESCWKWTVPQRMGERPDLLSGETLDMDYFERPADINQRSEVG